MKRLGARAFFVVSVATVCCVGGGSDDSGLRPLRYEELLPQVGVEREHVACADFTRLATSVPTDRPLVAALRSSGYGRLHLRACAKEGEGTLVVRFRRRGESVAGGAPGVVRLSVPADRWSEAAIEVPQGSDIVEVASNRENPVHLADLYVQTRTSVDPVRRRGRRQILLVSADTLRVDALEKAIPRTDSADRSIGLLQEAEIFERHYAGDHWTKPSHATLLTGQPVAVHGAVGKEPIAPAVVTLAERFRAAGFRTGAVVTKVPWIGEKFGFGRGFESYRFMDRDGEPAVRHAVEWMATHRDASFFYFLHLFDAHSDFTRLPYEAPGTEQRTVEVRFGHEGYGCRAGRCASLMLHGIRDGLFEPLAGEAEVLRFLYDRGVGHLRSHLDLLVEQLRAHRMWEGMTVALTSDHGEEFLEHDGVLHAQPYEEIVRIPLLIKWPERERAGRRHPGPSSAQDVAPTLLDAAGLSVDGLPGFVLSERPRRAPVTGGSKAKFRYLVTPGHLKLVDYAARDRRTELYDLEADPRELRNLAPLRSRDVTRLAEILDRVEARSLADANRGSKDAETDVTLSAEEQARLRALGY